MGQASECKVVQGKSCAGAAAIVFQTIDFYSIVSTGQGDRQDAHQRAKYSRDTVLPLLSQLQLQSMILVDGVLQILKPCDNKEER